MLGNALSMANHNIINNKYWNNNEKECKKLISKCSCGSVIIETKFATTTVVSTTAKIEDSLNKNCEQQQQQQQRNIIIPNKVDCYCRHCRKYHVSAFTSYIFVKNIKDIDIFEKEAAKKHNKNVVKLGSNVGKYRDVCSENGIVDRLYCKNCYSKLLTLCYNRALTITNETITENNKMTGMKAIKQYSDDDYDDSNAITNHIYDKGIFLDEKNNITKVLLNMGCLEDRKIPKSWNKCWKKKSVGNENDDDQMIQKKGKVDNNNNNEENCNIKWQEHQKPSWSKIIKKKSMMMMSTAITSASGERRRITGGCSCGKCKYKIKYIPPTQLQHCYCKLCRELSGSPYMTWVPFQINDEFQWIINGDDNDNSTNNKNYLQLIRTTPFGKRHVCTNCGCVMTIVYNDDSRNTIWPAAGGFDDNDEQPLETNRIVHICCKWKQPWYELPKDGFERISYAS